MASNARRKIGSSVGEMGKRSAASPAAGGCASNADTKSSACISTPRKIRKTYILSTSALRPGYGRLVEHETAVVCEGREDRAAAFEYEEGLVLVIADGAGGTSTSDGRRS